MMEPSAFPVAQQEPLGEIAVEMDSKSSMIVVVAVLGGVSWTRENGEDKEQRGA